MSGSIKNEKREKETHLLKIIIFGEKLYAKNS